MTASYKRMTDKVGGASLTKWFGRGGGMEAFDLDAYVTRKTLDGLFLKMAEEEKVKNLFLTHLVPAIFNTAEDKARFTKNMDQYYKGPITVVDDGDSLLIESDGKGCKVQYIPVEQVLGDKP